MNKRFLVNYAKLIVDFAVNVQKGQTIVVYSPVECVDFVRLITEFCYEREAKEIYVQYTDSFLNCLKLQYCSIEELKEVPEYVTDTRLYYANKQATFISIDNSDPDMLSKVDTQKFGEYQRAKNKAFGKVMKVLMKGNSPWLSVLYPSLSWAKKVFPSLSEELAIKELTEQLVDILHLKRILVKGRST